MELLNPPILSDWGLTVARFGGWDVRIVEMIFNDRVILFPSSAPGECPAYAWCYPKGPAAFLAVQAWNPDTEGAPSGYKKSVLDISRQPGETAADYLAAAL